MFLLMILAGCRDAESRPRKPTVDPRQRLLQRIGDINNFARPRPLVTLEEFFDGNNDAGSIGYNLADPPTPKELYDLLKGIRDRPDVKDVRIAVMDLEDLERWPSTDTIWIITSATPDQVKTWFPNRLVPDEVWDGFDKSAATFETYNVPQGMRAVGAWYD
jgi:hypothetical protein